MNRGFKIVKSGFPITETDPENLIFTSGKGVLGWKETIEITDTTDANGKLEETYNHGYGYVPIIFVYVTTASGTKIAVPSQWNESIVVYVPGDGNVTFIREENFYCYWDDENIYVKAYTHRYEPIMGGDDVNISGQSYTFEVIIYFNELTNEV